jgi:hypothetical protein
LPLIVSALVAAVVAPALLRALGESRLALENYRGVTLPFPAGTVIVAAAALAAGPLALIQELGIADDVLRPELRTVAIYAFGVAGLGLVDDALGGAPRGWRGHGAAALRGSISTGALKAAGSLGLALYALSGSATPTGSTCWRPAFSFSSRTCSTSSTCGPGARSRRSRCSARA